MRKRNCSVMFRMSKIIRSVFIAITDTDKQGKVSLVTNRMAIAKVDLDEYIKDFKWKN